MSDTNDVYTREGMAGSTDPRPGRRCLWIAPGLMLLVAMLCNGCLSKPPLAKQSFAFPLAPLVGKTTASGGGVLEIRQISVAAPFDSQSFTYRTGAYSYERDPYAQFLVSPEQCFVPALESHLRESGLFREVTGRDNLVKPDSLAEVRITELYGDFRNPSAPVAVLRLGFILFDGRRGGQQQPVLQKEYLQTVPFHSRTAAALMGGWNQALERIMATLAADLKSALAPSTPQPTSRVTGPPTN